MSVTKKFAAGLAATAMTFGLAGGGAASAADHTTTQDGLVNVSVGDVTVLEDVNVAVAANAIVQLCDINVNAVVGVLARVTQVDQTDRGRTLCRADAGDIGVEQN